jgi:hypothetical protein
VYGGRRIWSLATRLLGAGDRRRVRRAGKHAEPPREHGDIHGSFGEARGGSRAAAGLQGLCGAAGGWAADPEPDRQSQLRRGRLRMRSGSIAAVLALAATLATLGVGVAAKGLHSGATCHRALLSRRPAWASASAAAFSERDELLVIDQMYHKVLRYSTAGESLGTLPAAVESSLEDFLPITVKRDGANVVFELANDRMSVLGPQYMPVTQATLAAEGSDASTEAGVHVLGRLLWQPLGKDIVSFNFLGTKDDPMGATGQTGFVRFPVSDPADVTVLAQYTAKSTLRDFNRLGLEFLTTLNGVAYTLNMEDLHIYRLGASVLEPLPVDLREVTGPAPTLPPFSGENAYQAVMAAVETSTMPVGIYGWGDALFVVIRRYENARTTWVVTKIDPQSGHILGTATIPTFANHLTIVPGPTRWAFLEKGPVGSWDEPQIIPSVLFVPAERFAGADAGGKIDGELCDDSVVE